MRGIVRVRVQDHTQQETNMHRKRMTIRTCLAWATLFGGMALSPSMAMPPYEALDLAVYPSHAEPPPLASHTVSGEPVSLAKLRGNVVLLTFWATWCAECRPEMPQFERLHAEFAKQGLAVLGLNVREDQDKIRHYAKGLGLTFPLVLDPEGEIARSYGVIGIPTTILISRDGHTAALAVGPRDWGSAAAREVIQALLEEPAKRSQP
jgi:peroxiredoxin